VIGNKKNLINAVRVSFSIFHSAAAATRVRREEREKMTCTEAVK
jgi:hypothetical protein